MSTTGYKLVIAGSRDLYPTVEEIDGYINEHYPGMDIVEVVSGCASGVDTCGERWAMSKLIPITSFPADWSTYGRRAGPLRNATMAKYADIAIVIHTNTPGSLNMMAEMLKLDKPCVGIAVEPKSSLRSGSSSHGDSD